MSSILKQIPKEQEEITSSTLPDTRRQNKRFFKRQPQDSSHSNESRRSFSKTPKHRDSTDSRGPSYIRVPLELLSSMTEIQSNIPLSINQQAQRVSHLGKKTVHNSSVNGCLTILQRRVQNLENELKVKNEQLEFIQGQNQKLKMSYAQLQAKYKSLDQTCKISSAKIQTMKEELRKINLQNRKMEQDKQALNKKIAFLEKIQFTSDTKNIQTLRQVHLQAELQTIKTKLKQSKSKAESLLQNQIEQIREELFSAKKLIQSLQINNDCLQKKLQSTNYLIDQQENYNSLKSRYRKFLGQYKDLKKSFQNSQKQNRMLKAQMKGTSQEDHSLQISMFSMIT